MEKLTELCDHCKQTGLEPEGGYISAPGAPPPSCRVCNGAKYKLTAQGESLRRFVVATLSDEDVYTQVLQLARAVAREMESQKLG